MSYESARATPRIGARVWIAAIAALGAAIAVIPPMITALRSSPGMTQQGNGNTAINGSTVNSNNQTNNTYVSMWVDGLRTMVGAGPKKAADAPPSPQRSPDTSGTQPAPKPQQSAPSLNQETQAPEPGAIGTIVSNASLLGDATWSPEPSRVNRLLSFYLHAEAIGADDKIGSLDATLARDGKDICTISLNTRTSPLGNGVRWSSSTCYDTLPPNAAATYRARVRATEMTPIVVRLDRVDAVRK